MPRLSSLQEYILCKLAEQGGKTDRTLFRSFYETRSKKIHVQNQEKIITQSLERLIDRGFIVGFGRRTPEKWFITHVHLTALGRKKLKEIFFKKQKSLPLTYA